MVKYLVTTCLSVLLYAGTTASAWAMPSVMTTDEVKPGMQGYAETMIQGNQKVDFNIEIMGVLDNGKGTSKQILARAYGPLIDDTHGVIHGMSGSPVYVDGKLIGAVARAVGEDVLPYKFYITPIQEMQQIWQMPDPLATINKSGVKTVKVLTMDEYTKKQQNADKKIDEEVKKYQSKSLKTKDGESKIKGAAQKRLEEILNEQSDKPETVQDDAISAEEAKIIADIENSGSKKASPDEQVSITNFILNSITQEQNLRKETFATQQVPIYVSGFSQNSLSYLKAKLASDNMVPYEGAVFNSSVIGSGDSDIKFNATVSPGDAIGVVMAYGDFSAGATGTVTAVDGNKVLAFGHPMTYKGNVNYFMTDANVVGAAGGILNGMKVSSFGKIIGRINQDRFSGVSGILNTYPSSVPIRVTVKDKNLGKEESYGSKIAYDEDIIPTLASSITYAAMDRTADRAAYGTAKVKFDIATDEVPSGHFIRENMFYDPKDVGQFAVGELTQALYFLSTNIDKPSNIFDVKVNVSFTSDRSTASILSAVPDKSEVKPGDTVNFKVMLKPYRKEAITVSIPYTIPKTQTEGKMTFDVKGGGFVQLAQILQSNLNTHNVATQTAPADDGSGANVQAITTLDRLNDLQNLNKNNEIVITPGVNIESDADQKKAIEAAIKLSDEIKKMSKKQLAEMNKNREAKITTDYVIDNYVQTSVMVKK